MKKILIIGLCLLSAVATAQSRSKKKNSAKKEQVVEVEAIQEDTSIPVSDESKKVNYSEKNAQAISVGINMDTFTQLVFKSPVSSIKVGMPNLVDAQNTDNVVTLQALSENIKTNLIVKTADGNYYVFIIISEEAPKFFYEINESQAYNKSVVSSSERKEYKKNSVSKENVVELVYNEKGYINSRNSASYKKIFLEIKGVYIENGKLYFLFSLENKSNIKYDIHSLSFITVSLKKRKKALGAEEQEYIPLFYYKDVSNIEPNSKKNLVVVFDKFTINDQKNLEVTLTEKNGERAVRLLINTNIINNAKRI